MARAGLIRSAIKRARDTLVAQRQYPSIDAIRIALGNTGSKTTIHRYLKELEEEKGTSLTRAAAAAALSSEQDAHAETRLALHQRDLDVERLTQQVRDQTARLAEQESFRQSLEEKLAHSRDALEHFRTAARGQREQQVQQLQTELRQTNQTAIVKQNEITRLNKDNARLVAEAGAAARQLRDAQTLTEELARVRETLSGADRRAHAAGRTTGGAAALARGLPAASRP